MKDAELCTTIFCFTLLMSSTVACRASEYNITTFVENANVIGRSNSSYQHVNIRNASFNMRYELLDKNKGLANIIEVLSENSSKNRVGLETYFVGDKIEQILQEVHAIKKDVHSLEIENCSEVSMFTIKELKFCKRYKQVYVNALETLMKDVFTQPIMIIVEEDQCAHYFADKLAHVTDKQRQEGSRQDTGELYFHRIGGGSTMIEDIRTMLYKAITTSTATIILLSSDGLTELILARSKSIATLKSNVIWVTLESNIEERFVPSILLNLESDGNDDNLPSLSWSSLNLLNIKRAMIVGTKENQLSNSDAKLVIRDAFNLTQSVCRTKNDKKQTVLVSLRRSNFNWLPMYSWSNEKQITLLSFDPKLSWLTRSKFHKSLLRVVTILEEPFVATVSEYFDKESQSCSQGIPCRVPHSVHNVTNWQISCCIGFTMDLLERLQDDLWILIDLYVVGDGLYGSVVDGEWNGMVGELVKGNADLIMAPITTTSKRSNVIDFGETVLDVAFAIVLLSNQKTEFPFVNLSFVENIDGSLLLVLLAMFLFGLFFIYLLENTLFYKRNESSKKIYNFKDGFSYISGITFQRDLGGKNPKKSSARISFVVFAFAMVIAMSTYTATLTAVKVKQEDQDVFQGMNDPKLQNPTSNFKFATIKSSSLEEYFRFSTNSHFHNMHLFMHQYNINTTEDGIKKLLNG
eukprot:gene14569-5642_t